MTGILEMFAELSEPDFYDVTAQLELFCWQRRRRHRERMRRYAERVKANAAKLEARRAYQRKWKHEQTSIGRRRKRQRLWVARKRASQQTARAA